VILLRLGQRRIPVCGFAAAEHEDVSGLVASTDQVCCEPRSRPASDQDILRRPW
jgi:hypothetical protein